MRVFARMIKRQQLLLRFREESGMPVLSCKICSQLLLFCFSYGTALPFFFFSSRRRHTSCLSDWSSDVCSSDLSVPILTLLPVVARDQLHLDVSGYGLLMTCYGVGATLGALAIASQGGKLRRGATLTISSLGLGLAILAFSLSHSVVFCGTMLFLTGVAVITNNALINTLLQHRVPNELRGRVMAIYVTVYIGMNPIGSYIRGWIASLVGAQWAIGGMAAPMVVFTILAFHRYSELRRA